jgi:hypothetical protein
MTALPPPKPPQIHVFSLNYPCFVSGLSHLSGTILKTEFIRTGDVSGLGAHRGFVFIIAI